MTKCPFIRNAWKELATGKPQDWSWLVYHDPLRKLPSIEEIQERNFPSYWEEALVHYGFTQEDIQRCKNRMIMGSMRYKQLSRSTYYDYRYYMKRISQEMRLAKDNLEAVYDGVNIALLAWHAGILTESLVDMTLTQFAALRETGAPFNAKDRTEW